jgi:hypothetical protein
MASPFRSRVMSWARMKEHFADAEEGETASNLSLDSVTHSWF